MGKHKIQSYTTFVFQYECKYILCPVIIHRVLGGKKREKEQGEN